MAAFGDSSTDGFVASIRLQRRIGAAGAPLSVAGVSANQLLTNGERLFPDLVGYRPWPTP